MAYLKSYPDITTPLDATQLLNFFYPVGTIYETTSASLDTTAKMNTHFGGTWEAYGAGRVLVAKSADTEFDTIGETGGAKTHTLTTAQMPLHTHRLAGTPGGPTLTPPFTPFGNSNTGGSTTYTYAENIMSTGGGETHNNLQPYIVVYRYRRTA